MLNYLTLGTLFLFLFKIFRYLFVLVQDIMGYKVLIFPQTRPFFALEGSSGTFLRVYSGIFLVCRFLFKLQHGIFMYVNKYYENANTLD